MLARVALRNAKVILFFVVVFAVIGVGAYLVTPQSIFPAMTFPRVDVVAEAGDLPADRVRVAIARPLGEALQALPGVTSVVTTSSQSSADVVVVFASDVDPAAAVQTVDRAIAEVRSQIPDADSIVAQAVATNREPVVCYALQSNTLSQTVLRQIALSQIAPRFYGSPGLGRLLVSGGATPEYHVELDPQKLVSRGLSASDVVTALSAAGTVRGVATVQRGYQNYAVLVDGSLRGAASLAAVTVKTNQGGAVPLGALGTIAFGVSPVLSQTSLDGHDAVIVSAYAAPNADSVRLAGALETAARGLRETLPKDVRFSSFWDQTTLIVASQSALRDAILLGALIAVGVMYLFLRDLRLTLVAAAVIPLAMSLALLAIALSGQTLNLMSVGGLAVAVGLIIDDAIVVVEGIARNRRAHPELGTAAAIEAAIGELGGAMAASTATTVVVFLPLGLVGGVAGSFFRALAFTLSIALIVSLGLALFVAPVLARMFLGGDGAVSHGSGKSALSERYARVLRWTLAHRAVVGAGSVAALVLTVALLSALPSEFLPKMDEGQFEIAYTLPVGTSLQASDSAARTMESIVASDPAVAAVGGLTGLDSNGVTPTAPNDGALRVRLKPPSNRANFETVSDRLRDRLSAAVPAVTLDFHQILEDLIDDLSGTPSPIEITLRGDDPQVLVRLGGTVAHAISQASNIVDAATGVTYDAPSIRLAPRGARLAALGIDTSQFGDALAALGQGTIATNVPGARALVPVRVTIKSDPNVSPWFDSSQPVHVGGAETSLDALATRSITRLSSNIVTENGVPIDRLTANFTGGLSNATAAVNRALHGVALPPGYTVEIGGQARSQAESFGEFERAIGLAILLVFGVMLASFRSFRVPFVILAAVPLALIGVALGLTITQTAFNVSSFMGLLLLVGIVVKNGILLIDRAQRRRTEGAGVADALVDAGSTRLRPILMTTLAAIGGLLPLAIGLGQGAEMEKPLAVAVVGGLSTATIFTLLVIPGIYGFAFGPRRAGLARKVAAVLVPFVLFQFTARPALAQEPAGLPVFATLSNDDAGRAALAASPDVAAARARADEARAALADARGVLLPSLVSTYAQTPQGNPPGSNVISRQVSAQLQFSVADFAGYAPKVRQATLAYAAAESDEQSAEVAERVKTTGLYFDALEARALASAARDALALATANRSAAAVRFSAGDAARLDVTRADVDVAKTQAALETAVASDLDASDALGSETDIPPARFAALAPVVPVATNLPVDAAAAVALARATRPELVSAARTEAAAQAALAAARTGAFPALTLGGGYLVGTDSGVPVSAPLIDANLSIPLGPIDRDRVATARAKALEARAAAIGTGRRVVLEVASSARALAASQRTVEATARERAFANDALEATQIGYRSGASSSLELASGRATYTQAVIDDLTARYALAKAEAVLAIEIGR